MAARIRRELQTEVEMVHGRYGVFRVMVDDDTVIDAGPAAVLGILPSGDEILAALKGRVGR